MNYEVVKKNILQIGGYSKNGLVSTLSKNSLQY